MKNICRYIFLTLALGTRLSVPATQFYEDVESPLCLNVYIPQNSGIPDDDVKNLEAKLSQAISLNGFGSNGADNRFVIVPRAEVNSITVTSTIPQKTVVDGTMYLYVGDGVSSTLFASEAFPVKGVGNSDAQAFKSAFMKINPRDPRLQNMLENGRQRIKEYYEQQWPVLIKEAETAYDEGNYDTAVSILYSIPSSCKGYSRAMELSAEFAQRYRDTVNSGILTQARAAWSQSPNEQGAAEAMKIIAQIDPASSSAAGANALCNEIKTRLKQVDDREWQETVAARKAARELEAQREANASAERRAAMNHAARREANASAERRAAMNLAARREANASAERRAAIKAYGEIAKANIQRPVYNINWW